MSCWETTVFKVPQVFSKEGPGELPGQSRGTSGAEEGRNFCPGGTERAPVLRGANRDCRQQLC